MTAAATLESGPGLSHANHPDPAGERAPARVLVVDARPLVQAGLVKLARAALGCPAQSVAGLDRVAGALENGATGETVILLGVRLGDDAVALVERARRLVRAVICVLDGEDPALIHGALAAPADGHLLLELLDCEGMRAAVAAVQAGEKATAPELGGPCGSSHPGGAGLTARCLEVLRLLAAGLHDREIADRLGISTSSVRKHICGAEERLGARTRTQAVAVAVQRGLL